MGWRYEDKMSIKLALLKSGETVISDAKELISDDKVCGYLFTKPHIVELRETYLLVENTKDAGDNLEVVLTPWIVLTSDKQIPVPPDWIVTIVEPIDQVKQIYEEKVNGKTSKVSITEGS
jgi:hypothetical protein